MVTESSHAGYARERLDAFAARCRAEGLAVTPQRLAIIDALLASTSHPCAEEIFAAVRVQHPYISLATVHRTLETFCRIGEARKVTVLHESARYDANLTPHQHVVCIECRAVRDIELPELIELIGANPSLDGFETLGWSLEIQARCARCAGASTEPVAASTNKQLAHNRAEAPRGDS